MNETPDELVLRTIVQNMVDRPEAVRVERSTDEQGVLLSLHVDPSDMGKVIGIAGATAKAIRAILRCVGMRNNARVNMKIIEPEGSAYSMRTAPAPVKEKVPLEDIDKHIDL